MDICARCVGVRTGHWTAIILMAIGCLSGTDLLPVWWLRPLLIVPMAIDGGLQLVFGVMSNNPRRVVTGLLGGFGIGATFWGIVGWVEQSVILWYIYN